MQTDYYKGTEHGGMPCTYNNDNINAIIDLFALSLGGRVKLTKKLPAKLGGIAYENLHLKGGFVAEASYDMDGNILECRIRSQLGNQLILVGNWQIDGCVEKYENGCTVVDTVPGGVYVICPV